MRETYGVVIMARKTRALQIKTGNTALRSRYDLGLTTGRLWRITLIRPAKMLVFSPIIFLLSLFMAVVYGYLYLLFTTFPVVFGEYYHFSIGITGLVYLGLGVGNIIGLVIFGVFSDKVLLAKAANGELKPEYRLLPMVWTALTLPIGLFLYGWSARYAIHWIVPIIGTSFFGIGLLVTLVCTLTYVVDGKSIFNMILFVAFSSRNFRYGQSCVNANTHLSARARILVNIADLKLASIHGVRR